jgi:hypothetical protein
MPWVLAGRAGIQAACSGRQGGRAGWRPGVGVGCPPGGLPGRPCAPPAYGLSLGPMIVACQWKRSSPTGPAEQFAGGSFFKSSSSFMMRLLAIVWGVGGEQRLPGDRGTVKQGSGAGARVLSWPHGRRRREAGPPGARGWAGRARSPQASSAQHDCHGEGRGCLPPVGPCGHPPLPPAAAERGDARIDAHARPARARAHKASTGMLQAQTGAAVRRRPSHHCAGLQELPAAHAAAVPRLPPHTTTLRAGCAPPPPPPPRALGPSRRAFPRSVQQGVPNACRGVTLHMHGGSWYMFVWWW